MDVGIFGAGAIGGYLGIRLAAAGVPVRLVGRPELLAQAGSLVAVDLAGRETRPGPGLSCATDAAALAGAGVVLVTLKSGDTRAAADALAKVLAPGTPVISFQNGLGNAALLRERGLAGALPGMVTFNVRRDGPRFQKATDGPLLAAPPPDPARAAALVDAFARAGEPLGLRRDMEAVQVGKLLLNLNNGICAATGLSIAASLRSRDLRRVFAACVREGLAAVRAAGLPVATVGKLPPALVARVLPLPDALFFALARSLVSIDPAARSSTLQDLDRGKATEIDHLNGAIVELATRHGLAAPANAFVAGAVHRLERAPRPLAYLTPAELRAGAGL